MNARLLPRNSIQKIPVESMAAVSSMRVRAAHGNSFDHLVGAGKKRWRHREAERLAVVRSMTRSNFVEARRMRVCYPSRPSARMVSCTFGLAPIRAMYALMFGHFAR